MKVCCFKNYVYHWLFLFHVKLFCWLDSIVLVFTIFELHVYVLIQFIVGNQIILFLKIILTVNEYSH